MNQIVGKNEDGKPFLVLVLEPGNLHRLREGKPILLHIEELFPEGRMPSRLELSIYFSETPIADARELAKHAEVALDFRTPVSQAQHPHCPECGSTIEQLGMWSNESPISPVFCPQCGCVMGMLDNRR